MTTYWIHYDGLKWQKKSVSKFGAVNHEQCNAMFLANIFIMCSVLNENIIFLRSEGHILLIGAKFL